ncbi:UNVERIFIED_CONTAM: hypothetical protein FKN15_064039 [Acipenser sinensis]
MCRYGVRWECCYGWKKNSKGHCEAFCEHGCKHGECVGPNKCKCLPGFTGKTCNQDLNECGLKPRPCEHRCMNTHGSYKCYCLNGYMLMVDGSCANSRTCSMTHCQYGCEEVKGEVRCLCPSTGLQLGTDGRTCTAVPDNSFKDGPRILGTGKDSINKLLINKGSKLGSEEIRNVIPEPKVTFPPKIPQQPFDYDDGVYIGGAIDEDVEDNDEDNDDLENRIESKEISTRGDVFNYL